MTALESETSDRPDVPVPAPGGGGRKRLVGAIAFVVGLLLVVAAVFVVARRGVVGDAMESARAAEWWVVAGVALLPIANWALTSVVFGVLTRRYGRVGWGEMAALIGSAWLLNMLPLRPGMVGRVTYHKVVNGIRVRHSAAVLLTAILCTTGMVTVMVSAVMTTDRVWPGQGARAAVLAGLVTGAAAVFLCLGAGERVWRIGAACAVRYADVLLWAVRYWLVFRLVGHPVSFAGAAIIAAASQASMAIPIQFGVREWIVGLAAGALPVGLYAAGAGGEAEGLGSTAPGLAADLVNRAAELLVVIPVGLGSSLWLWGRRSRAGFQAAAKGAGGAGILERAK